MPTKRFQFLDFSFDCLTFDEVRARLEAVRAASPYGYVVTPNVDHVVRVHREPQLRGLYEAADLCVCDSRILRFLARLSGIRLPLVPGSDLARVLFADVIKPGDRVAVIGSSGETIRRLRTRFPAIEFVHHEAPMGLRDNLQARTAAAAFLAHANARFAFLAVGSPQQEMIAREARGLSGSKGIALCIGAGLEFLTGEQKRAPRALQGLGLEWAHRLATNPRRLWRRYLVEGVKIFPIYLRSRGVTRRGIMAIAALGVSAATVAIYGASLKMRPGQALTSGAIGHEAAHEVQPAEIAIANLPPPNLLRSLSPEEAAKENADRPFVDRRDTPASRFVLGVGAEDQERALTCLAQTIYYEAAGEGIDGGRAVAQVVLNRVRHPGYPASICGVVYQGSDRLTGCQFTFTCDGSLLRLPEPSLWARSRKIAAEALAGRVFAPIGHATAYHADYVLPYWADSLDKVIQVGRHIFYRLRGVYGDGGSFFQRYSGIEPQLPDPRAAVVLSTSDTTAQLASALMSDGVNGPQSELEKPAEPASALAVDSSPGTLVADAQIPAPPSQRHQASNDCPISGDSKKLAPLGATDMRPSAASGC